MNLKWIIKKAGATSADQYWPQIELNQIKYTDFLRRFESTLTVVGQVERERKGFTGFTGFT